MIKIVFMSLKSTESKYNNNTKLLRNKFHKEKQRN